ncbi:MAG: AarF/UbiB family protein [Bdellovibrionota bacterium]
MLHNRVIRSAVSVLLFARILLSYVWFGLVTQRRLPPGQEMRRRRLERLHEINARRLYKYFVLLKGVYIKIGQFLSTQAALLPPAYLIEMVKMQDQNPVAQESAIRQRVEEEFGGPPEEVFQSFSFVPLACASIGQVHRATLKDGREAVIKVKYPGIDAFFFADLKVIQMMIPWFIRILEYGLYRGRTGINYITLIDEFVKYIGRELDYRNEAYNQKRMHEQLAGMQAKGMVYVPRLYTEYCRENVICMEYIEARKIVPWYVDPQVPSQKKDWVFRCMVECLFFTIAYHGFFQADTHPGNFMVLDAAPHSPEPAATLVMLDFGCTKDFPEGFRAGVVQVINGYLTKQYSQITEALWEQGFRTKLQTRESFDLWVRQGIKITDEILGFFRDGTDIIEHLRLNLAKMAAELWELNEQHRIAAVPEHYAMLGRVLATAPVPLERHMPKVDFLPIAMTYVSVLAGKAQAEKRTRASSGPVVDQPSV